MSSESKRSGRRPGKPDTREEILAAARTLFATQGINRTSVRQIAAEANVDPALVHHYFGSKKDLFLAAVDLPLDPSDVVDRVSAAGIDGMGDRLIRAFVTVWDSPAGVRLAALMRSAAAEEQAAVLLRGVFEDRILVMLRSNLGSSFDHPQARANLVASQLFGLALTRYLLKLEPMASFDVEDLVVILGPTIQRYLTMDLSHVDV